MATFQETVARIAGEIRRTTIEASIKDAINDAIRKAAVNRLYVNQVRGQTFVTVPGQEYYPDLGLEGIDAFYYYVGSSRYNVEVITNLRMDDLAFGNALGGQLMEYSRVGQSLRLYPIPSTIITLYLDGYGKLTPWPLVDGTDTSAWLSEGELYIRALAKFIVFRDTIRDYNEAAAYEAIAADELEDLMAKTAMRLGTGNIIPTEF